MTHFPCTPAIWDEVISTVRLIISLSLIEFPELHQERIHTRKMERNTFFIIILTIEKILIYESGKIRKSHIIRLFSIYIIIFSYVCSQGIPRLRDEGKRCRPCCLSDYRWCVRENRQFPRGRCDYASNRMDHRKC